eukprot:6320352-Pyramimonas_sp.AAC.1
MDMIDLMEEPDMSVLERNEIIQDYDVMEARSTQNTTHAKATDDIVESLQPEKVFQIGFVARAWKMLNEPTINGDPAHVDDVAALSFYEDGPAKAVIER